MEAEAKFDAIIPSGDVVEAIAAAVRYVGAKAAVVEVEPWIWEMVVEALGAPPNGGTWLMVDAIPVIVAAHEKAVGIEVYDESRLQPSGVAKRRKYLRTAAERSGPS